MYVVLLYCTAALQSNEKKWMHNKTHVVWRITGNECVPIKEEHTEYLKTTVWQKDEEPEQHIFKIWKLYELFCISIAIAVK